MQRTLFDIIKDRLFISAMDEHAPELAREYDLGLEIIHMGYAPNMDEDDCYDTVLTQMDGIARFCAHAPYGEMLPFAIDPLVREVTRKRFLQFIHMSERLGIHRLIFHGNFIPIVYYPEWYVEQSILFWKELMVELGDRNINIAIENVMENSPLELSGIICGIADHRVGICLDIGHAINGSGRVPLQEWIDTLGPHLIHVHLHNNNGTRDTHSALNDGIAPMSGILQQLAGLYPDVTYAIECPDARPSIEWLLSTDVCTD